jgi:hypothetical protein
MIRSLSVLMFAGLAVVSGPLQAQARPQPQNTRTAVPQTHLPPPGMCRIWLDNVPPSQQPAPTDCASAARNLPRNGRLIYNDEPRNNPRLPLVKSFTAPQPPPRKAVDDPPPAPAKKAAPQPKPAKPTPASK